MRMPAAPVPTREFAAPPHTDQRDSSTDLATSTRRRYHKSEIASLSMHEIADLSREELIAVVRSVPVAFVRTQDAGRLTDRLEFLNRKTLERLAFIARRCCRNQGY